MAEEKDFITEEDHHGHGHSHVHDCSHEHHDHDSYHDHDHHHGTVHISHHEGAVIGAMQGSMPIADYDKAEKLLASKMREAGRLVTEAGGIIGHIKFIVTEAGRCGQISVTDTDEHIRHFEGGNCRAEGVAIVFGVADDKLTEILTDTIGKILEKG